MPASKDFGQFFVLAIKVTSAAGWAWFAPTFEIEHPFRVCKRCLIVRLKPFKTALVFGHWRPSGLREDAALRQALSARVVELDEPAELAEQRRTVRDNIAAQTADLDDEWRLISMLGLEQDEAS